MISPELFATLQNSEKGIVSREKSDRPTLLVPVTELAVTLQNLKNNPALAFDMLCDLTAIDWPALQSIELVYQLYSTALSHSMAVTCRVPRDQASVPTSSSLWAIAEWQEREIFDLFGVTFTNHPDLRRLLLDDDWVGHPLRRDYVDPFILPRVK